MLQAITEMNGRLEILIHAAKEGSVVLRKLVTERSDLLKETREDSLSKRQMNRSLKGQAQLTRCRGCWGS